MESLRQFGNAVILALISIGLVFGGLSLSLVEFAKPAIPESTEILLPSPLPLTATATLPPPLESSTPTNTALPTETPPPPPSCSIPGNWIGITVQAGDTLESLAVRYRISPEVLRSGNCLLTSSLVVNSIIFVPNVPANTTVACIPGAVGWVNSYRVQPGDTFFRIALNHYTTAPLMKQVNCHPSDRINPGDLLWVPNTATRTPTPSLPPNVNTFTPNPTDPLTETALPFTGTPSPTNTVPPATLTPSATPTTEPTQSASPTPFP